MSNKPYYIVAAVLSYNFMFLSGGLFVSSVVHLNLFTETETANNIMEMKRIDPNLEHQLEQLHTDIIISPPVLLAAKIDDSGVFAVTGMVAGSTPFIFIIAYAFYTLVIVGLECRREAGLTIEWRGPVKGIWRRGYFFPITGSLVLLLVLITNCCIFFYLCSRTVSLNIGTKDVPAPIYFMMVSSGLQLLNFLVALAIFLVIFCSLVKSIQIPMRNVIRPSLIVSSPSTSTFTTTTSSSSSSSLSRQLSQIS